MSVGGTAAVTCRAQGGWLAICRHLTTKASGRTMSCGDIDAAVSARDDRQEKTAHPTNTQCAPRVAATQSTLDAACLAF
jgi:hypothetical protein